MADTPWGSILGGVGALGGIVQSIIGGGQARRAQRALENLQTPTTTSNQAISDYYNQALNPYSSLEYQMANQSTGANLASGLSAAQDRRGGLAAIGGLVRQRNNALLGAAANAQSRLGQATQMKAADDQRVWQVNKLMPYEKLANLYAAKAGGGNALLNAGLTNAYNGLGTAAMFANNKNNSYNPYYNPDYNPDSISGRYPQTKMYGING